MSTKLRALAFFDGQNLFRHAKDAFGHYHPNYDPKKLFEAICENNGWESYGVRFYTGVPNSQKDPAWHKYWTNRLLALRRSGVLVEHRPLRYRTNEMTMPDGTVHSVDSCQEKGIDIRIALDILKATIRQQCDVIVIFSQDQDLAEVVKEIKEIARDQRRTIKIVSAFPSSPQASTSRGIDATDWLKISKELYDACLDPKDYR